MSDLLIKGVEMPKDKAVAVVIHPDGTAYTAEMFAGVCTEYLSDCTAVPVPAHGRLIDADALKENWTHRDLDLFSQGWGYLKDLNRAPTIIPAEPEKPRELMWREWNYIVPEEGE